MRSRGVALGALVAVVALAGCGSGDRAAATGSTPGQPSGKASETSSGTSSSGRASTSPSASARPPITVSFGGDVHFEGSSRAALSGGLKAITPALSAADLTVVNLETAVTDRGTPAAKEFTFRAPASAFPALRAAGVDAVTMANNHAMDYGQVGLADSLAAAKSAGMPVVGAGVDETSAFTPYVATVKGTRVAVVGATQVLDDELAAAWTAGPGKPGLASAKDTARVVQAVRDARKVADVVLVDLHWGTETVTCPTDAQRGIAQALAAAGADAVVGSHAHVLLGAGWLGRTYVDYGLGNFVFYARPGVTAQSGVLTLTVTGHGVSGAQWAPAQISGGLPVPLTGSAAAAASASWDRLRSCTGLASSAP